MAGHRLTFKSETLQETDMKVQPSNAKQFRTGYLPNTNLEITATSTLSILS
jgi:hypothetical protein